MTKRDDARAPLDAFAAQPDQLMWRDVFQGTGGSLHFLSRQDIAVGTAVVHIVYTDRTTGCVTDRIALATALDGTIDRGLVTTTGGDTVVTLEVQ